MKTRTTSTTSWRAKSYIYIYMILDIQCNGVAFSRSILTRSSLGSPYLLSALICKKESGQPRSFGFPSQQFLPIPLSWWAEIGSVLGCFCAAGSGSDRLFSEASSW
ncbi:hypothetical protein ACOSQ2_028457 [Xanthoceras sorbifolium]